MILTITGYNPSFGARQSSSQAFGGIKNTPYNQPEPDISKLAEVAPQKAVAAEFPHSLGRTRLQGRMGRFSSASVLPYRKQMKPKKSLKI